MALIQFENWNPSPKSIKLIKQINSILDDYESQGYQLTLRQLYYQLVSRDIIPNTVKEYGKIGNVVSNGRMAGLIDWNMIEDRIRIPKSRQHFNSPSEILRVASRAYYRKRWDTQDYHIEVWVEKDAVSNIIEPICYKYDATFLANRGYSSISAMYQASLRFEEAKNNKKQLLIIYLGDHDPSGMDMSRDVNERMDTFAYHSGAISVDRIALNMDQVEQYDPPENPAKVTDSRFKTYASEYGTSSWELDALEPHVLENLVADKIKQYIDFEEWEKVESLEKEHITALEKIAIEFEEKDMEE